MCLRHRHGDYLEYHSHQEWRVINQIKSKTSLETLAAISNLKYFGHMMCMSDSMQKDLMVRLTDGSRRGRQRIKWTDDFKTSQQPCETEHNRVTWFTKPWRKEMTKWTRNSKTQHFLPRKSYKIIRGCDLNILLLLLLHPLHYHYHCTIVRYTTVCAMDKPWTAL
jgi:hypothetical protein